MATRCRRATEWSERWKLLARYEIERKSAIGAFRLVGRCTDSTGKRRTCTGTREQCARRVNAALHFNGFDFCPENERTQPEWLMAMDLYNASLVSPIAGWPDSYAPWLVRLVQAIHDEVEMAKKPSGGS